MKTSVSANCDMKIAISPSSAASQDDLETVVAWHTAGADINVGDYDRRTPLHVVSTGSHIGKCVAVYVLKLG